jgi:hypothetical protein
MLDDIQMAEKKKAPVECPPARETNSEYAAPSFGGS